MHAFLGLCENDLPPVHKENCQAAIAPLRVCSVVVKSTPFCLASMLFWLCSAPSIALSHLFQPVDLTM